MQNLISNSEAASVLGISPFSLRRKVLLRQVPFVKIGRRVLFSLDDLTKFIEANKVQPRPREEAR